MRTTVILAVALSVLLPATGAAQPAPESPLPPRTATPQLVIDHAGPHAPVNGLAFGPDGTLYAGGFGKLVHRYALRGGKFVATDPLRVPVGPGNAGAVNAVAVSPDGKWVAVAGRAPVRGEVWAGADDGITVETRYFPPLLKRDYGVVYLFDPTNPRGGKVIRGPEGGVRALAFANPQPADGPVLVTAGVEWDTTDKHFGAVRVYDVATGKERASRTDLPANPTRPGLEAWATGEKRDGLRVAVAWPKADNGPGDLLVWNLPANRSDRLPDGRANLPLAVRVKDGAARDVISGGFTTTGRLAVRPAAELGEGKPIPLTGTPGQQFLPLAVAPVGDALAVVVMQVAPADKAGQPVELRLFDADGKNLARVPLSGVATRGSLPTLAASRDGRFLAVGGFADNRLEVYDAAALGDGKAEPQKLAGAPGGYARVAFLEGNRLWLGGADDTAPRGGRVFDFAARKATTGGDGDRKLDAPPGGPVSYKSDANKVTVTAGGKEVKLELRKDERPTAAAYLPAGPPWDKTLGAVVAVAHHDDRAAVTLITLYDAATGRRLLELSGPTLPVEGLAFSGSKPLLAAVGADRVVSVWTLRNLGTPFAAIEGVTMVERGNELAVAGVEPDSPARGKLAPGDVVEAIGGEKGDPKPVKNYREFLLAVRELPVGSTARVRVKGKAVTPVPVGRGVGFRHPLLDLWIDPAANKDGGHDWIGWTPAGPYDANSPAAEARLGWLSSTGDPAEPVRYAGADQYRRLYYKTNFLRFLVEEADFGEAFKKHAAAYPRTAPLLTVTAPEQEDENGLTLLRSKPASLTVRLDDPGDVIRHDRAVLRWRPLGRGGKPGEWQNLQLAFGEASIDLPGYAWTRGPHAFEVAIQEAPDLPPAAATVAAFHYVPPMPLLAVVVDGQPLVLGQQLAPAKDEIRVAAEVDAPPDQEVEVTLTTSAGDAPVKLPRAEPGKYGPVTVKLRPDVKTVIRLTAANVGTGEYARFETFARDVAVRYTPPKPKPAPVVRVSVASPTDPPAAPGKPHVSDTAKVRIAVEVTAVDGVNAVEWDAGDGKWVGAILKLTDDRKVSLTREVTLPAGKPLSIGVRATTKAGVSATDAVPVVWAGLPAVEAAALPEVVRGPELAARFAVKPPPAAPLFTLTAVVEPADPAWSRQEVAAVAAVGDTWVAGLHLAPGGNRVGLVLSNEWKTVRLPASEVRYARPPLVLAVAPVQARGAGVGDVAAVVLAPAASPPDRITVNRQPAAFKPAAARLGVFGLGLWKIRAESVPLKSGGVLPKTVQVAARNAEGDGPETVAAVIPPPPAPPPPPPPRVSVRAGTDRAPISEGGNISTDQPTLAVELKVNSAAKLTRVEVLRPGAAQGQPDRVPGIAAEAAVPSPDGGFVLTASADVPLREGVNQFEVTATASGSTAFRFTVSYTPPPVRVVIDGVDEARPDGEFSPLPFPAEADKGFVRVRGRVLWSAATGVDQRAGHQVVLVSNEVRHLPVEVAAPAAGAGESGFVAPLFLNANETQVRVEVHARGRTVAQARQQVPGEKLTVRCKVPLTRQRLHVLVIGPMVAEGGRATLAREVIAAVGGEYPADRPGFDRGPFKHKAFTQATLYRPLVYNVGRANIVGLLQDVEAEVRRAAGASKGRPTEQAFQNDVVLVYYQGCDLMGKDRRWRLHTTRSMQYVAAAAEPHAVRLDELPRTPGVQLSLLNVVTPDQAAVAADPLAVDTLMLRYAWKESAGADVFLAMLRKAVVQRPTLGGVVDLLHGEVLKLTDRAGPPLDSIPETVRDRQISSAGK